MANKPKEQATGNGSETKPEDKQPEKPKEEVRAETPRETKPEDKQPPKQPSDEDDSAWQGRRVSRRFTQEDLVRNAEDIAEHFGDGLSGLLEQLAKQVGMRLVPDDGRGKTPTGKFVVRHGIRVQPKGEDKVRTVRPGEVVSLSEADAEFFMKKKSRPIEPELV